MLGFKIKKIFSEIHLKAWIFKNTLSGVQLKVWIFYKKNFKDSIEVLIFFKGGIRVTFVRMLGHGLLLMLWNFKHIFSKIQLKARIFKNIFLGARIFKNTLKAWIKKRNKVSIEVLDWRRKFVRILGHGLLLKLWNFKNIFSEVQLKICFFKNIFS